MIELWMEGYRAQDNESDAVKVGTFKSESLQDAVLCYRDSLPESERKLICMDKLSFWGCRFFDNEKDARKNYG